jgi:hypothetical protein
LTQFHAPSFATKPDLAECKARRASNKHKPVSARGAAAICERIAAFPFPEKNKVLLDKKRSKRNRPAAPMRVTGSKCHACCHHVNGCDPGGSAAFIRRGNARTRAVVSVLKRVIRLGVASASAFCSCDDLMQDTV